MYKGNSKNLQRRSSRINNSDVSASREDLMAYALDGPQLRAALGLQKQEISKRVSEIKKKLDIRSGVQHREVKGWKTNTALYMEWGELAARLTEMEMRLRELPSITSSKSLSQHMLDILEHAYPDIYDSVRKRASTRMSEDQKHNIDKAE